MKQLLFFIFLLIGLGQLQRIQLSDRIAFYIHDLLLTSYLLIGLNNGGIKQVKIISRKIKNNYKLELIFLSWGLISLLIQSSTKGWLISPWLYILRLSIYLLSFLLIKQQSSKKNLKKLVLLSGLTVASLGLMQYLFIPDARMIGQLGWDNHYYRLISSLLDPNFTGIILVLTFINWQAFKSKPALKWLLSLILVATILLTYSRASYLSFVVTLIGFICFSYFRKNLSQVAFFIALGAFFLAAIPLLPRPGGEGVNLARTSTIESRIKTNQDVIQQTDWSSLIIGKGLFWPTVNQNISHIVHAHFPDNLFVFVFSSTGLIGSIIFSGLIIKWLGQAYLKGDYWLLSLGSILIHAQFNHTLFEPFVLLNLLFSLTSFKKRS